MRLVDRHIWKELVEPFIFGVAAFTSIFFAGSQLQKLTNYMLKGLSAVTALELVCLVLPGIIVLTLPMATLLAILQAFGRLSSDSEVVALYSSGVSLRRIALPVAVLGIIVSIASFAINESVVPWANRHYDDLLAQGLKEPIQTKQVLNFVETKDDITTQVIILGGINVKDGLMRDVTITQFRDSKPVLMMTAERATRNKDKDNTWTLHHGYAIWPNASGQIGIAMFNKKIETKEIKLKTPAEEMALSGMEPEKMSTKQLAGVIRAKKPFGADTSAFEVGLYNKFALPMASLVFAMLALPLGIKPHRSGTSYGMGLSVTIILVYWLVWHFMTGFAEEGTISPMVGAFTADILGLVTAALLLKRAPN